jgi:hypothetical protein
MEARFCYRYQEVLSGIPRINFVLSRYRKVELEVFWTGTNHYPSRGVFFSLDELDPR